MAPRLLFGWAPMARASSPSHESLIVLPALTAQVDARGHIGVTGKFLSGMQAYVERWDGPVRVLIEGREGASGNLDDTAVDPATLPYEMKVVDYAAPDFVDRELNDAGVVFGSLGWKQNDFPLECIRRGIPLVTTSENTLHTRHQWVRTGTNNPVLRARRELWEINQEYANHRVVMGAGGIQCNGTPTYNAYKNVNDSALLFFDTRTPQSGLVSEAALDARLARVLDGKPLRLAYTGRLMSIKGVDHLAPFAAALKERGVQFELSVCGGGPLEQQMHRDIERFDVGDVMTMKGVLDFDTELVPFVQNEVDLFVCPHVQGDPSCTYMETFACGVPMVGYANEALAGLTDLLPVGWMSELGDPQALAAKVAEIDQLRTSIAYRSRLVRDFAKEHTMERTFDRRIEHLQSIRMARPSLAPAVLSQRASSPLWQTVRASLPLAARV